MSQEPSTASATAYYNSACPICRAGIDAQKGIAASCSIEWVDVHAQPEAALALGIDIEAIRERLHVVDLTGQTQVGASAFAALWQTMPSHRWLGRVIRWPVVGAVIAAAYDVFAKLLYLTNRAMGRW